MTERAIATAGSHSAFINGPAFFAIALGDGASGSPPNWAEVCVGGALLLAVALAALSLFKIKGDGEIESIAVLPRWALLILAVPPIVSMIYSLTCTLIDGNATTVYELCVFAIAPWIAVCAAVFIRARKLEREQLPSGSPAE